MNTTAPTDTAPAPAPAPRETAPEPGPRTLQRITALDALRGFALCGILLINIPQITQMAESSHSSTPHKYPIPAFLDLFVLDRFFPIFSFLFGLSFAIFLEGAARRSSRPRLQLVRRLSALALLGVLHHQLQPGEALLPYAIIGLLILLPASWLPTWVVLPAGLLGLAASVTFVSGGIGSIPGLFLLGLAFARLGIARTLDRRTGQLAAVLALTVPAAAATVWWQHTYPAAGPIATRIAALAGLLSALAYATAVLLILRTRPGRPLSAILEPLGRMALTNYLTATLIVVAVADPLGLWNSAHWGTAMVLAVVILAVQAVFSRWWLARFQYGPMEWCLRCVTWWSAVQLRRSRP
ncbi:putative membrane protein YeiB [Streptomyces sp. 846.5]|nr:DUF418 domain-containing protein [Streptomyces sp. 846.5]TDU05653.1 putative membrane protein YeiB [Streptomyces sp. 846.5]